MSHQDKQVTFLEHIDRMEVTISQLRQNLDEILASARAHLAEVQRVKNMGNREQSARSHLKFAQSIMKDAEIKLARAQQELERAMVQLEEAEKGVEEFEKDREEQ